MPAVAQHPAGCWRPTVRDGKLVRGHPGTAREPFPFSCPALGSLAYRSVKVKGFLEGSLQPVQDRSYTAQLKQCWGQDLSWQPRLPTVSRAAQDHTGCIWGWRRVNDQDSLVF